MNTRRAAFAVASLAGLCWIPSALGQYTCAQFPSPQPVPPNCVSNQSFEEGRATNPALPRSWRPFNTAVRRFVGDGGTAFTPRTGIACMELPSGSDFSGLDTNVFDATAGLWRDPAYTLGCGPATFCAWYMSPVGQGIEGAAAGLKLEFRRPNTSVYDRFEFLPLSGQGYADGTWKQLCISVTQADWDYIFNYYNNGNPYPELPNSVSLLPMRFGGGTGGTGTIFWDDATYQQFNNPNDNSDVELWDDFNVRAVARRIPGVVENPIPVTVAQVTPSGPKSYRAGNGCSPNSTYNGIEIFDVVNGTGGFPLTFTDIIANGYVRPLVQRPDGTTNAFGTSVVTQPGFRPNGAPIDIVPDMTAATLNATWVVPVPPGGPAVRADPFGVQTTGSYSGVASLSSMRLYPDPTVGQSTKVTMMFTWTASQTFTLPTGRGNDAFRLAWLSSMLSSQAAGTYDANYIGITTGSTTQTLRIPDSPRNVYLFPTPRTVNVGDSVTLFKDTAATWNPGSSSINLKLIALSGAAGPIGVQGYLAPSTDPNDDSLNVWFEWVGAPATVNAGTAITATFEITATPATAKGDGNHDGSITCADVDILNAIFTSTTASANFNAYVDMNNDGVINLADHTALNALAGGNCAPPPASCVGDFNGDNAVNTADLTFFLGRFGQNVTPGSPGDINGDGSINTQDLTTFLGRFGLPC